MLARTWPAPSLPLRHRAAGRNETPPARRGLLLRRVPAPNAYMDDPFRQHPPAEAPKHLYSNMERLQQLVSIADASFPPHTTPRVRRMGSHHPFAHGLLLGFPLQQQSLDRAAHGQRKRPVSAVPTGAGSSALPAQAGEQRLGAPSRGSAGSPRAPQPHVLGWSLQWL